MTKQEFKERWESNADGGGISLNDVADCAKAWGLAAKPRIMPVDSVLDLVLKAAGVTDAEEFHQK